jgi:hypothetical protein
VAGLLVCCCFYYSGGVKHGFDFRVFLMLKTASNDVMIDAGAM